MVPISLLPRNSQSYVGKCRLNQINVMQDNTNRSLYLFPKGYCRRKGTLEWESETWVRTFQNTEGGGYSRHLTAGFFVDKVSVAMKTDLRDYSMKRDGRA